MKAEIRFINGEYYITQGDKKILADDLVDQGEITAIMPDGKKVTVNNVFGEILFKAACCLGNLDLEDSNG